MREMSKLWGGGLLIDNWSNDTGPNSWYENVCRVIDQCPVAMYLKKLLMITEAENNTSV
jgi:hypothetical protein